MRILDENTDLSLNSISLLLSKEEAVQLIGYLEELVEDENLYDLNHFHFNSTDYLKEITLSIYNDYNIDKYSDRYKTLIKFDK